MYFPRNPDSTPYNVKVQIQGSTRASHVVLSNSYGGAFNSKVISGSHTKSLQNYITHTAYGLIGTGGTYIGIVHDSNISNKTQSGWKPSIALHTNNDKKYTATVSYSYTNAYVLVTTNVGSTFTLYAF